MIGDISICKINIVKFVVSVATLIQIQNYKHKIIDTPISIPNFIIIDLCNCKWSMKNNKFIYIYIKYLWLIITQINKL